MEISHKYHWLYIYDAQSSAARISFPDRFIKSEKSLEEFKVQMEFYWNPKKELAPEIILEKELEFLKASRVIPEDSELLHDSQTIFPTANIIPTVKRHEQVEVITRYLEEFDIRLAGRYGSWSYLWSHESAQSGYDAAM
jgi:hypothetical protein